MSDQPDASENLAATEHMEQSEQTVQETPADQETTTEPETATEVETTQEPEAEAVITEEEQAAVPTDDVQEQTAVPTDDVQETATEVEASQEPEAEAETTEEEGQAAEPTDNVAEQAAEPTDNVAEQAAEPTDNVAEQAAEPTDHVQEKTAGPTDNVLEKTAGPTDDDQKSTEAKQPDPQPEELEAMEPTGEEAPKGEGDSDQPEPAQEEAYTEKEEIRDQPESLAQVTASEVGRETATEATEATEDAETRTTARTPSAAQKEETGQQELEPIADVGQVTKEAIGTGTEPSATSEVDHALYTQITIVPATARKVTTYDHNATATVKFVLMPSGQVATLRCHLGQTLSELREHFSHELKMAADILVLLFDSREMNYDTTLGELGVGPNGTVRLEMHSSDPINSPIKPFRPRQEYHMPDVITVRVPTGFSPMTGQPTGYMDVVVEIERSTRKKPFLGGYRHKSTGVEYHHASGQTIQKLRAPSAVTRYCRDTQTTQQRHILQQTANETCTQMTKIGTYVSNIPDKLIVPGCYTTADEHINSILDNVILIQKYYRRWLARRYVDKVRQDKGRRVQWEKEQELRKKVEKEAHIKREFERRMNPKTKEDFDLLYHALEKWRLEEVARINAELTGAERKAALCQLLEQETQLIASVGRHKLEADGENHHLSIKKFLDSAAAPKRWRGPDGKMTAMDTPYTIRAQQMKDIYNSINMKYLTQDERLDILLTLKHTVKEHDCKLTQEIIALIDREADLLMRGVKESNLDGLRKRISTLFLQYVKTPAFNPEAARLIKVPQDPSTLRSNIYFCSSCNQYLPSTEFQLSSNSRAVGTCRNCSKTDNDARVRQDFSHYRLLLRNLRHHEDAYGDGSKIAFLLQETDLRHLVENVWNSQSILSAWGDLYDLTLVRWIRAVEWSPWNCILLTKEEASAHEKLVNLDEAYGKVFVHRVKHKHTLARSYFSRLPGMADHMRARAEKSSVSKRTPPSAKPMRTITATPINAQ